MKSFLRDPGHPPHVLVSGGAGFIGASLVAQLSRLGATCTVVDDLSSGTGPRLARLLEGSRPPLWLRLDVTRPGAWRRALREAGPLAAIVHLAGRVGVGRVLADPEGCRAANLDGARRLVEALAELPSARRPRVLGASTSEVYAERSGPLAEGDPLRPESGPGRWAYAGSKRAAESLLDGARGLFAPGREPLHLRFFNVVGPGQDARAGMVVPTFVERALAGRSLPVHGSGEQVRTFGHVDDVARALARLALAQAVPGGPLNLGGSARASVLELARRIARTVPGCGPIELVDPRQHVGPEFVGVGSREPDLSRARGLGLPLCERTLGELVEDCVRRHADLALGAVRPRDALAGEGRPVAAAAVGDDVGVRLAGGGVACASPGS